MSMYNSITHLFVKIGKVLNLGNLDFDIVSDLDIRISDFASRRPSTTVKESLQIGPFMQNKPNFKIGKMNATLFTRTPYENKPRRDFRKTHPIQSQTNPKQSQNKPNFPKRRNEPKLICYKGLWKSMPPDTSEKQTQFKANLPEAKMNENLCATKDYVNIRACGGLQVWTTPVQRGCIFGSWSWLDTN
jgi:hypothetical protein